MPQRSIFQRQKTPLMLAAFIGGGGIFIALKWRAVMNASEKAKDPNTRPRDRNYAVAPGRSGGGV